MKKVLSFPQPPSSSIVLNGFVGFHYVDCFAVEYRGQESVDVIATRMFSTPSWADSLMVVRDKLVGCLGLKTDDKSQHHVAERYEVGEKAVMFTVIARNEMEIVMAEDDKHLNFRTSMLLHQGKIYSITVVRYNNFFGRFYFFFVKPFHAMIIKSGLAKLSNSLK